MKRSIGTERSIIYKPTLILMLLPGLILLILFRYIPFMNITIAFRDFNIFRGIADSDWVGLKHFQTLFSSPDFFKVLGNTFILSGLRIIFGFPAPIILALLLKNVGSVIFKRFSQNIFYLPHFVSWVVIAGLCFDVFSRNGVVNSVIGVFGIEPISFLMSPDHIRGVLVASDIWKSAGWGSIIYLAALTAIDPQLYEAAKIDGAGRFAQLRHITIPCLMPTIIVLFILRLAAVLDAGFEQVLMFQNSMVIDKIDIIDTYAYRLGIGNLKYDFATAVGLFKSVVSLTFVVSANKIIKMLGGDGLW